MALSSFFPAPADSLSLLTQLAIILAVGIISKAISNKTKLPFIVLLIFFGTLLASMGALNLRLLGTLPETLRVLALIIVVFSAGFHLKLREVKADGRLILSLVTIGVFLTMFIIGGITFFLLSIPLISAIALGALLSGSDSAAISSAEETGKESRVKTILVTESVFNQPLTLILPLILLDYLVKPELAWLNVPKFFVMLIVGGVVGIGGAFWGQKILDASRHKQEEIVGLMIAIGVYVIAENFLGSGIVAVAITSLLLGSEGKSEKKLLGQFTDQLAFLFTIFVFILLGMQFTFSELFSLGISRYEIIVIVIALVVARMASVLLVTYKSDLGTMQRIKLGLIAPNGISPAAMAPLFVAYGITGSQVILKIVYIAIVVSVFISIMAFRFSAGPKSIEAQRAEKKEEREEKKERLNKAEP